MEASTLQLFASLTAADQRKAISEAARASGLPVDQLKALLADDWRITGRPKQQAPPGDWSFWWVRAGRGFGKTLTLAQWAKRTVLDDDPGCRFKLVAPTQADVRKTMVEGETGLLSILPAGALLGQSRESAWSSTKLELRLSNGTLFEGFSSEKPDRIRGPQHGYAWCEEISSWKDAHKGDDDPETTWANVKLSTRLGRHPRVGISSTPKANALTKALTVIPGIVMVVGSSYENRDNLAEAWWRVVVAPYEGTRTGRQEIEAEILEDVEGALWRLAIIDALRVREAPPLHRVVVGVDPNASTGNNAAGVIVAGHDGRDWLDRAGYVLADRTVVKGGPRQWAQAAVDAYHEFDADLIVAEKNNGGDMVALVIKTVDPTVPVKLVTASRGKRTRAEPIASIYEGSDVIPGRVHHVGAFPDLEEEMTTWTVESDSPDRMDALVWALWELLVKGHVAKPMRSSVPRGRIPGVNRRDDPSGMTR